MCQECGQKRSKEEMRKIAIEIKAVSEETSNESEQALCVYKRIEKLQELLYHPFSVILLRTQEKIIKVQCYRFYLRDSNISDEVAILKDVYDMHLISQSQYVCYRY